MRAPVKYRCPILSGGIVSITKANYTKVLQNHLVETVQILKLLSKEKNTTRNKFLLISFRSLEQMVSLLQNIIAIESKRTKTQDEDNK